MKIAPIELAQQNQFLLTMGSQDPNQLLKAFPVPQVLRQA
jgi:hypothetical protein